VAVKRFVRGVKLTRGCWKKTRRLLYSPKNLLGRIREQMVKRDTARQILLMLLMVVISTGAATMPSVFQSKLPFAWKIAGFIVMVILMASVLRALLWLVQILDERDEAEQKAKGNTLEDAMQRQTNAIVAALRENSEAVIRAMKEPLDGHE
jgi:hypothetical protein